MLRFYQLEWCPECHTVRQAMTELGLTYDTINVTADREHRSDVVAVSGQSGVPVLEDDGHAYVGAGEIIPHLRATYPEPADAREHVRRGAWRLSRTLDLSPADALVRLRGELAAKGLSVVAETPGAGIAAGLPAGYVHLSVALPEAAAKAFTADPLAPAALLIPVAVVPADAGGCTVAAADPVGQVWLYGAPSLRKAQHLVKGRLAAALEEL
jgi:glutathione S-transferase